MNAQRLVQYRKSTPYIGYRVEDITERHAGGIRPSFWTLQARIQLFMTRKHLLIFRFREVLLIITASQKRHRRLTRL